MAPCSTSQARRVEHLGRCPFSGHGAPGKLAFEDDEGRPEEISIDDLVRRLRERQPHGVLPPFFYLASCHGNTPPDVAAETAGSGAAAARLHREGVAQVVGYSGPIVDELSRRLDPRAVLRLGDR